MRLSIVIPTLNEAATIQQNLQRALALRPHEVIVADGGSEDETAELARAAGASVVTSVRGRGRQLNTGSRQATGDVLLFLHADCWLEEQAAEQIEAALLDDNVVGGAFQQRIDHEHRIFRWLEWGNAVRVRWRRMPYGDQGIFLRRSAFEALGSFAEVRLLEDVLLMREIRHRGWRIEFLPGPIHVDPRRWLEQGVVRQTVRNWLLLAGLRLGIPPDRLADFY
jgi:rSAM/selenodomain-associated transferase 2